MSEAIVQVMPNGPLRISGDFKITDAAGAAYGLGGRTALGLCRCGKSKNSPFCDGTHAATGFQAESKARDLPPKA